MKRATITIELDDATDRLRAHADGNLTPRELNWALDILKQSLLGQKPNRNLDIAGMLTPDLKRVPADVARRMLAA
jgi:hypothetical protein